MSSLSHSLTQGLQPDPLKLAVAGYLARYRVPRVTTRTRICGASSRGAPSRVDPRDVQIAARHADPRTTVRYHRVRDNFDRQLLFSFQMPSPRTHELAAVIRNAPSAQRSAWHRPGSFRVKRLVDSDRRCSLTDGRTCRGLAGRAGWLQA